MGEHISSPEPTLQMANLLSASSRGFYCRSAAVNIIDVIITGHHSWCIASIVHILICVSPRHCPRCHGTSPTLAALVPPLPRILHTGCHHLPRQDELAHADAPIPSQHDDPSSYLLFLCFTLLRLTEVKSGLQQLPGLKPSSEQVRETIFVTLVCFHGYKYQPLDWNTRMETVILVRP